ncbi:MAG: guanylate kinase [Anaerolineae bacterium]|nr:guanylate kinase [Anaerolineae bacterium]
MDPKINFDIFNPTPLLIVISGLSGAGKDAVVGKLKEKEFPFHFVVTATSRPPRPNEVNGVDYFFFTRDEFQAMIARGDLIEYALVYDQFKGVPKQQVEAALSSGKDVVMRVDYQGAKTIRSMYPDARLIFILPENPLEWLKRLVDRGEDSEEQLKIRLDTAQKEMEAARCYFDYVVINPEGKLDQAADMVISIINAEHHRILRQHDDKSCA